jgi:hypothetical protein
MVIVFVQDHASVVAMLKGAQGAPGALFGPALLVLVSWKSPIEKCQRRQAPSGALCCAEHGKQ